MHSTENGCYRTGKYTVCKRVRASFSPENLQAGAVMGLIEWKFVKRPPNGSERFPTEYLCRQRFSLLHAATWKHSERRKGFCNVLQSFCLPDKVNKLLLQRGKIQSVQLPRVLVARRYTLAESVICKASRTTAKSRNGRFTSPSPRFEKIGKYHHH